MHFCIFGYRAYVFLSSEVCANKLALHSELMIFIGYKDNGYHFICYIQGNIIFHSTHTIFDKELCSKCTNSHAKEYKLYNKLLNKNSPEIVLSVSGSSEKDRSAPVPIPSIQNNSSTHFSSPFLSYKSLFSLPTLESRKSTVEIEKDNNIDSDIEMQPLSP